MNAMEVGQAIVDKCNAFDFQGAIKAHYAENVKSVEAGEGGMFDQVLEGRDKILEKNAAWSEANEVHGMQIKGPFPHGDRFILLFELDVTPKVGPMAGERFQMGEAGLYTVANGQVVQEEFFYHMG